jgi:hypothetical protein
MSVTTSDSNEMEKHEGLAHMETVLEVLNEGVIIADDRGPARKSFVFLCGLFHDGHILPTA